MSEESAVERFTNQVRRVMWVIGALFVLVLAGGVAVAHYVDPLAAVAFVIVVSTFVGMIFPRLT